MSKKIKVAAYARVSTEHEAQIYALGNQLEWYKKEIAKNPDYELVNIYVDEGITGTSANKRDGFMRMIEDAKKGKFQKIITRETARFARNTIDTLLTVEELEEYDVSIEFVCDSINTEDKDSELRLSIMAAMAQEESRKISQRVKCGQQVSMENGVIYGNGNILGYDRKVTWIDEKTKVVEMVINPEQAKTVKMIFDWYLGGWGIEKIKYELEKAGRLTAQGKTMWHASVISKTLKNPFYCGIMVYHKEYTPSYKKQKKKINYDKIPKLEVEGKHEPIVSKEDFDRVQKKLESRRQSMPYVKTGKLPKGHRPATSIWCSILECACGHNFNRRKWNRNKTSTQYGYQCYDTIHTGSVQTRKNKGLSLEGVCDTPMVQEWKLQMMSKAIFDNAPLEIDDIIELASSMIEKHIGDTPEEVSKNNKGIEEIRAQIEKLEKRIDGYLDMCADGEISKEKFLTKKAQAESEIMALEEKLEKLTPDDTATVDMPSESISERLKALKNALLKYADFTTEDDVPDKIVDAFVEKVVVSKDGFDWYMRYSPENAISCNVEGRKGKTNVAFAPNTPFTSSHHRLLLRAKISPNNESPPIARWGFLSLFVFFLKVCYNHQTRQGGINMTLEEYRIGHSTLIEQYQWIEFDLEGLYAAISDEPYCQTLREIEKDSIGGVMREIKKIEKEKNITVFSDDEYQELDMLRERRNFWSHVCYTEAYDKITGAPRNAQMLAEDLLKAETFLERLREIKEMHMDKNRKKIIDSLFC